MLKVATAILEFKNANNIFWWYNIIMWFISKEFYNNLKYIKNLNFKI
jgi:hypothetical protein